MKKEMRNKVKQYLLECLKGEDPTRFKKETIGEIRKVAIAEKYASENERKYYHYNPLAAIKDWFQGLGLSAVDYAYEDVNKRMILWGYPVTENNEEYYYNLYWDILAKVIFEGR